MPEAFISPHQQIVYVILSNFLCNAETAINAPVAVYFPQLSLPTHST